MLVAFWILYHACTDTHRDQVKMRTRENIRMKLSEIVYIFNPYIEPGARDSSSNIRRLSANTTFQPRIYIQLIIATHLRRRCSIHKARCPELSLYAVHIHGAFLFRSLFIADIVTRFFFVFTVLRISFAILRFGMVVCCLWYLLLLFDTRLSKQKNEKYDSWQII